MHISEYDAIRYTVSDELVVKLRDAAIDSAIEAKVRKQKWEEAAIILSRRKMASKFGDDWYKAEGVIQFQEGPEEIKLDGVVSVEWWSTKPTVGYTKKLKSGKYSKHVSHVEVETLLAWFKST